MTDLLSDLETPSDGELISRVRGGDTAAYGELFSRHVEAARRLARQLARGADADDLVADAFAKVLQILQNGGGPDVAFRAYLLTSVRRLHVDRIRAGSRLQTSDDMTQFDPGVPFQDTAVAGFEHGAAARAFASLPERWQLVLWHLEVEGQKPAEIAPLLGMSANSVSALAYRAREGLRQAFLTMHLSDISVEQCRWVNEHLGAYVRKGLSRRDTAKVEEHLDDCRRCMAMYLELTEVNSNLAGIIAPLLLGGLAAGYLSSTGAVGAGGLMAVVGRVRDAIAGHAGVATAGAVAAGVVTAVSVGVVIARSPDGDVVIGADDPVSVVQTPSGGSDPGRTSRGDQPRGGERSPGSSAAPGEDAAPGITEIDLVGAEPSGLPTADPTDPAGTSGDGDPHGSTTDPAGDPTGGPDGDPRDDPNDNPGGDPTQGPTGGPTGSPTSEPTTDPTGDPTSDPTPEPTDEPSQGPSETPTPSESPSGGPIPVAVDLRVTGLEMDGSDLVLSVAGVPSESVTVSVGLDSTETTFAPTGTDCVAGPRHAECIVPAASLTTRMMAMIFPGTSSHEFRIPLSYPEGMDTDDLTVSVSLLAEGVVYEEANSSDNTGTLTFEPSSSGDPSDDPSGEPSDDPSDDPSGSPTPTDPPSPLPDMALSLGTPVGDGPTYQIAATVSDVPTDATVVRLSLSEAVGTGQEHARFVTVTGAACTLSDSTVLCTDPPKDLALALEVHAPPGLGPRVLTITVTSDGDEDPDLSNNSGTTTVGGGTSPEPPRNGADGHPEKSVAPTSAGPYTLRTALTETSSRRPVEHREPPEVLRGRSPLR